MKKDLEETIKVLQDTWENLKVQEFESQDYWESVEAIDNLMWRVEEAKEEHEEELQTYYDKSTIHMDCVQEIVNDEVIRIIKKDFEKPVDELVEHFARLKEVKPGSLEYSDVMDEMSIIVDNLESEVRWI